MTAAPDAARPPRPRLPDDLSGCRGGESFAVPFDRDTVDDLVAGTLAACQGGTREQVADAVEAFADSVGPADALDVIRARARMLSASIRAGRCG